MRCSVWANLSTTHKLSAVCSIISQGLLWAAALGRPGLQSNPMNIWQSRLLVLALLPIPPVQSPEAQLQLVMCAAAADEAAETQQCIQLHLLNIR